MIILSQRFDQLDHYISDAAQGVMTWSEALAAIAPMAGADAMSMDMMFGDNRMVRSLGSVGFDPAMIQAYSDHYHRIDPRIIFIQKFASHGVIFTEELRRPDGPEGRAEFWEWLDETGTPSEATALSMPLVGDARIVLAVHREPERGDNRDVIDFFQRFYDKMNAINAMHRRRAATPEGQQGGFAYPLCNVDCFSLGVDDGLTVNLTDEVTRYRLPLSGVARIDEDGQLIDLQPDFQAALAAVLQGSLPPREIELTFHTPLADTMVRVAPALSNDQTRQAQVTVTYLKHTVENEKVFMRSFGLTRRQAELLEVLRRVYRLDEAAEAMSISRNTARVFLAQMFERTGVRSKVDLLRLANRFA